VAAERPLMIVGGSGWSAAARADMTAFAEAFSLPAAAGFRCQDRMDNTHPLYVGELGTSVSPALAARVEAADLLLVVGERLGEITTSGYTLVKAPDPDQLLIHVQAGAEELCRVYRTALPINAAVGPFFAAARELAPAADEPRRAWAAEARRDFEAALEPRSFPGALDMGAVMTHLRAELGPDAIITNGAGNYTGWAQRHYLYRSFPTQIAPQSGAMGYGVPAAVAAKALHPECDVICFAGDGCFMMSAQEIATAVQHDINVVILVVDNGMFGTIRMHQERRYPDRVSGTRLTNPDFAAFARSFGAFGETVVTTEEFAPAFAAARAAGKPAVLHLILDPEVLSTRSSLSETRDKGRAAAARGG
jgi:acetolactate synthase-1/2/3 large subunit